MAFIVQTDRQGKYNACHLNRDKPRGCPAPQVTVKVKVKSRLNTVIGADFHIGPINRVYQQTG